MRALPLLLLLAFATTYGLLGYNDDRRLIQGFRWKFSVDGKPAPSWSDYQVHWTGQPPTDLSSLEASQLIVVLQDLKAGRIDLSAALDHAA